MAVLMFSRRNTQLFSFKQVRSDNDASEVGISGHFGGFPSHFRPFLSIIGSFEKNALRTDGPTGRRTDGQTDRRTDRPFYRDAWTYLKNPNTSMMEEEVISLEMELHVKIQCRS